MYIFFSAKKCLKVKGEQHLSSFQNNLICIGIDRKVDQRTLFYEHGIENNNQFLTRVCNLSIELSEEFIEDLGNDQRLLYEYYKAVTTGKISEKWLGRRIGPMTEARWMTRSIRVLALYTRKQNPSDSLIDLVKFIIHIYVPGWFSIKQSKLHIIPSVIFSLIQTSKKELPSDIQITLLNSVQNSCYVFLKQNFIYCLLKDLDPYVREMGQLAVTACRSGSNISNAKVIPPINMNSDHWSHLISLDALGREDEPPCTRLIACSDLRDIADSLPDFPSNSCSVERAVRLVSQASKMVYGEANRHQLIKAQVLSHLIRPESDSKHYYASDD